MLMGGYPLLGFPLDFAYCQVKIDAFPVKANEQQIAIQTGIDIKCLLVPCLKR
jgi:hypothetical protein